CAHTSRRWAESWKSPQISARTVKINQFETIEEKPAKPPRRRLRKMQSSVAISSNRRASGLALSVRHECLFVRHSPAEGIESNGRRINRLRYGALLLLFIVLAELVHGSEGCRAPSIAAHDSKYCR